MEEEEVRWNLLLDGAGPLAWTYIRRGSVRITLQDNSTVNKKKKMMIPTTMRW
jgi:hypothetical protein